MKFIITMNECSQSPRHDKKAAEAYQMKWILSSNKSLIDSQQMADIDGQR